VTDTPRHIDPRESGEEDDLVAAEYVLGMLSPDARRVAEARVRADPVFAARVAEWQEYFAGSDAEDPPSPSLSPSPSRGPDPQPAIKPRRFGTPERAQKRVSARMIAILSVVVAVALVVTLVVFASWQSSGLRPPPAHYAATLEQRGVKLVFTADWSPQTRELQVTRTAGPSAGPGHDYELWLIDKSGAPVSLGLLRGHLHRAAVPMLPPGAVLAVSLEPSGGARSGQPIGPVLVKGVVARL
jgi:anti-sigma-K factor RskA